MIHPNCDHVCSGDCRRVGCCCKCGEWHDTHEEVLKNGTIGTLEGYYHHGKTYDAEGNLIPDAPPHDQDCPCCRKDLFGSKENDEPTYETATLEEKMKMMLEIAKEANEEQRKIVDEADDRQRLHIEVIFNTRQNPGSVLHLREIAKAYLAPKGIELHDDLSIEV